MTNKEFGELLGSYLAGQSTPEEYLELIRLIKGGAYDEILKQQLDDLFADKNASVDLDPDRTKDIMDKILRSEKHTAKLIKVSLPGRNIFKLAVPAAAIVLAIAGGWWLFAGRTGRKDNKEDAKLAGTTHQTRLSPVNPSGKKYLRLEDGSTVLLNEGSRIEYTSAFNKVTREVTLFGEAYFEIQQDRSKPFIVHTGNINTTVLGTAFNIRAYPGQKEIVVTVTRGKVKVEKKGSDFRIASSNESVYFNTELGISHQEKADAEKVVDWKKDCFILENLSMAEAAVLIGNRYHVTISFSSASIRECRISTTFLNNESLEQVLTVISQVIDASYAIQPNDQVIISGPGCL